MTQNDQIIILLWVILFAIFIQWITRTSKPKETKSTAREIYDAELQKLWDRIDACDNMEELSKLDTDIDAFHEKHFGFVESKVLIDHIGELSMAFDDLETELIKEYVRQ